MTNSQSLPTSKEAKAELARRELARRRFKYFAEYAYEDYISAWHTELLCDLLERVEKGEIRFVIIEMPPRHSKSVHVSQLFPAYVVGKNDKRDVIVSSYSGELAIDHGRETRNIIKSQKYQNVFKTELAPDSDAKGKWNTTGGGAYNAVGVGGSTTGKGADFFIVDDPFKDRAEADSLVVREARFKWLRSVARTRLTPNGAMVVLHTRWHDDDIIGRITEGEETKEEWVDYFDYLENGLGHAKWVRLTLKAIAVSDELYRKEGEALWPGRYSLTELEDIKKSLGGYEFSALYQQNPVDDDSREFHKRWFKRCSIEYVQKQRVRKFATIDPNLKNTEGSDYVGVTRNYVNEANDWHFAAQRLRLNSKGVIDLVFKLHDEGFEVIGLEEGAFSYVVEPFMKDEMRLRGSFPRVVSLKHNQTMKEVRIRGLQPRYQVGKIYHIENMCDNLEEELLVFPRGAHDDVADSAAYQIQVAKSPSTAVRRQVSNGNRKTNIAV